MNIYVSLHSSELVRSNVPASVTQCERKASTALKISTLILKSTDLIPDHQPVFLINTGLIGCCVLVLAHLVLLP